MKKLKTKNPNTVIMISLFTRTLVVTHLSRKLLMKILKSPKSLYSSHLIYLEV